MSASASETLAYIRDRYNVPAQLHGQVRYTGSGPARLGSIVGTSGASLLIRLDGERDWAPYHPTWEIEYLCAGCEHPHDKHDDGSDGCFGNWMLCPCSAFIAVASEVVS